MTSSLVLALFFTVALLVTTTYFLMGGLPLLTLKHDTPLDARFVSGFFGLYYKAIFVAALGAAISYLLWGRPSFAIGAVAIALIAALLRKSLIPLMQRLDARIQARDESAVKEFRRVHSLALFINLVQVIALVWCIIKLSPAPGG